MSYGLPSEGTRRLRQGLGWLAVLGCLLAYALLLVLHGPPYWPGWWAAMAIVLAASFFLGRLFAPLLEWVIAGYRDAA
ncbi:MAG TPA: hypothetical protein VFA50_16970 [Stellaceae bacterium]|nr:hypothetical protein [Stellaceae bacterium]